MTWFLALRSRIRALLKKSDLERDLDEELRFHLEQQTRQNVDRGMSKKEARRQALIAFGGVDGHKEACRDARGVRPLDDFGRDLRYAARTLGRAPGFSLVAVLTLAIGVGAVTAIFALVNAIVIQPLPYPDADRLVVVRHSAPGLGLPETGLSSGTYFHYRAHAHTLDGLAVYDETVLNLSDAEGQAERIEVAYAGPDLFRVLGVTPLLGRLFTEEDASRGFMDGTWTIPVLLSHGLWQSRYGGDPGIVGRIITVNDLSREVVGVLPADFAFPRPETQLWMLDMPPTATANFAAFTDLMAIARLRPGVTPAAAEAELKDILPSIEGVYPDATAERLAQVRLSPIVLPLKDVVVGDVGTALWALLGGMAFLLLVACANVANLFLVRAEHRAREVAVRTALGARRADLIRLFLSETVLLTLAGAALGLLLAGWGLSALVAFAPVTLPRLNEVGIDGWVLAFTSGVAMLAALVFGVLSVVRQSRPLALPLTLGSGGSRTTGSREKRRASDVLVAAQVALALVLLAGSALMVQSFFRLVRVDPGFDAGGVLTVEIGLPYRMASDHKQVLDGLLEPLRALPGVRMAAAASTLPLSGERADMYPLRLASRTHQPGHAEPPVALKFFTPGFFQTMRTPVLMGTGFAPTERAHVPHPVVVSAALAHRLFPGESAIGKQVRRLDSTGEELFRAALPTLPGGRPREISQPDYTIAGVVADVRDASLRIAPQEVVYIPILDPKVEPGLMPTEMSLVIRSELPPASLVAAVWRVIGEVDPGLSVSRIRTMDAIVAASAARESFVALLLLIAGAASLLLGAIGIYAVVAYAVRRRTQEIGIRIALGARADQVSTLVLRESLAIVLAGAAIGLVAAFVCTRVLRSLLFGVSAADPVTLAGVTALLVGVALLAGFIPARRAARMDPTAALRSE